MNSCLISEYYRDQNSELLKTGRYGGSGYKWIPRVREIYEQSYLESILDYGCGLGTLKANYPDKMVDIREYDPCIPEKSELPEPADLVVCNDVLEHVEPEFLDNVLEHLASCTKKVALVSIALRESNKDLPDGRNAHLIIENRRFWIEKLRTVYEQVLEVPSIRKKEITLECYP